MTTIDMRNHEVIGNACDRFRYPVGSFCSFVIKAPLVCVLFGCTEPAQLILMVGASCSVH